MGPDESTVSAAYEGRSDKCTKGGNQAHPTSISQLAANYLVPATSSGLESWLEPRSDFCTFANTRLLAPRSAGGVAVE